MQILVFLEQTLTAEAVLKCADFLDMSQQRVKFPDIWVVYRPFQKQTLNSHPIIFNIHFMLNFRDLTFNANNNKLKLGVFSNPGSVNRVQEEPSVLLLTNKQSVYGLILDELMQYYKLLPLELDFSFLKSMRKVHNMGEELADQEQLQRAAEILIQAKNKVAKEQISIYKSHFDGYLRRCPNALAIISSKGENRLKEKLIKPRRISSRQQFKKVLPQQKFIERIRSQGKQQNLNNSSTQKRSSFLLHPNLIRFQSSNPAIKKAQFSKEGLGWRLPRIIDNSRMLQDSICSSIQKSKHIRVFFSPMNRSSNTQRAVLLRNILFSSKHSNVSGNSFQKQSQKEESVLLRDKKAGHEVSLQLQLPNREDEPKKNRKLMLQLLREKSKQALLGD